MSNETTTPAAFQDGDRVVCADGVARTVRGMAPQLPGEPAHVVVEDGTEWIAANCRRANPEDLAAARTISHHAGIRVRQDPGPASPQWCASLADLTAAMDYLKAAETDGTILAAIASGAASAARDVAEITARHEAGADTPLPADQEEAALREEAVAHFTVLAADGNAHAFQRVQPHGASFPVAWTYRTGYGSAARYGWVTARSGRRNETPVEYRWQAERAALDAAVLTDEPSPVAGAFATVSVEDLRKAVDRLRDRAARTRGTRPQDVFDDGVRAALEVLAACHFAEVSRGFNPGAKYGADDHDWSVTGLVVEPAADGCVRAYWVENGRYVTANGSPFTAQLRDLRRKFQDAGWETVPGGVRVVSAYRPTT